MGKFYYPVHSDVWGKSAPYIFNLFTEAFHWIIQKHIPARLRHYLDNFLAYFQTFNISAISNAAIDWIENVAKALGLSFSPRRQSGLPLA